MCMHTHTRTHTHTHTLTHTRTHTLLGTLRLETSKCKSLWPFSEGIFTLHLQITDSVLAEPSEISVWLNFRDFVEGRAPASALSIPQTGTCVWEHARVCVPVCVCVCVCACVCLCVCGERDWEAGDCPGCAFIRVHQQICRILPALPFWEKGQFSSFLKYHNICVSKNYYKCHQLQNSSLISILSLSKFEKNIFGDYNYLCLASAHK